MFLIKNRLQIGRSDLPTNKQIIIRSICSVFDARYKPRILNGLNQILIADDRRFWCYLNEKKKIITNKWWLCQLTHFTINNIKPGKITYKIFSLINGAWLKIIGQGISSYVTPSLFRMNGCNTVSVNELNTTKIIQFSIPSAPGKLQLLLFFFVAWLLSKIRLNTKN